MKYLRLRMRMKTYLIVPKKLDSDVVTGWWRNLGPAVTLMVIWNPASLLTIEGLLFLEKSTYIVKYHYQMRKASQLWSYRTHLNQLTFNSKWVHAP